ncbi:Uu.00g112000.m01.CDS01 [Anthostomella pinea]|uniref:Uu.00g112000.m01.CDS01 n=1 Tax=Anthostomella pinea TaxID=933095 RepID=A0AAI8VF96_9PEZI|nr:Uu.00g112000.m01.CDS01 [Anthostomella pinea]
MRQAPRPGKQYSSASSSKNTDSIPSNIPADTTFAGAPRGESFSIESMGEIVPHVERTKFSIKDGSVFVQWPGLVKALEVDGVRVAQPAFTAPDFLHTARKRGQALPRAGLDRQDSGFGSFSRALRRDNLVPS